jgi:cytochrome P450
MTVDLNDPYAISQLYPRYDQLRNQAPLHRLTMPDGKALWLASSFELCQLVTSDRRFVVNPQSIRGLETELTGTQSLASVDPPDHTRLRRLAQPAFAPKLLEGLRPKIERTVDNLISAALPHGRLEIFEDFAFPMITAVISDFLGFPFEDRARIAAWTNALIVDAVYNLDSGNSDAMMQEFTAYLLELFEQKRLHPSEDVIGALVRFETDGDRLSEEELIMMVMTLIGGGFETTIMLIGQGLHALLEHRDQFKRLRNQPELVKSAIEELLRYTAGGVAVIRYASEPLELNGIQLLKGAPVMPFFGAANFDPARFENPAQLDITRNPNRHLSFGHSLHFCLGAPLARLEGEIAFAALVTRLPTMRLADEADAAVWSDEFPFMRSLRRLVVQF